MIHKRFLTVQQLCHRNKVIVHVGAIHRAKLYSSISSRISNKRYISLCQQNGHNRYRKAQQCENLLTLKYFSSAFLETSFQSCGMQQPPLSFSHYGKPTTLQIQPPQLHNKDKSMTTTLCFSAAWESVSSSSSSKNCCTTQASLLPFQSLSLLVLLFISFISAKVETCSEYGICGIYIYTDLQINTSNKVKKAMRDNQFLWMEFFFVEQ